MVKRVGLWLLLCLLLGSTAMAQSADGKIKGKITDETGAAVEFATVIATSNGIIKGGANTDETGAFSIAPLPPGEYEIKASFAGNSAVASVTVITNKTTQADLQIETGVELKEVKIYETIPIDNTTTGGTLTKDDIQQIGIRNINTLAAIVPGVYQADDGGSLNMRGGRNNATTYYVDGVKVRGLTGLPQKSIGQLTVITGGTPAEYGDVIGGIISITSAAPSYELAGGVELLSSQFLDGYGYNLIGVNLSGPILTKYIDSLDYNKPILGFFLAAEGEFQTDSDPAQGGVFNIKDEFYNDFRENPLELDQSGNFFLQRANFVTDDQVENIRTKLNNRDDRVRVNARLDFQPAENIIVKAGGTYENIRTQNWSLNNSMFARDGNQRFEGQLFRGWVRFQQNFPGNEDSKVKNLFYTLQADYNLYQRNFMNNDHRFNIFDYGHIGTFDFDREPIYRYVNPRADDHNNSISSDGYFITAGFRPENLSFSSEGSHNPLFANYNEFIFDYVDQNGIVNPFTGQRDFSLSNLDFLAFYGGLRNGDSPDGIYSLFSGPGASAGSFTKFQYEQYRITGQASGEIKGHSLKAGFEFEQRTERFFGVASRFLWNYVRQLTNRHLVGINPNANTWELVEVNGVFQDTVNAPIFYDAGSQSTFDANLRSSLGLPVDGLDFIITDGLQPEDYQLEFFSADELLNDGSYLVNYYGFDYKGRKQNRVADEDFFTDEFNRPMNAFAPTYVSGFIQDKFELEDIIFNIGVRVDRFDANQKVLNDIYVLFPTYSAKEVAEILNYSLPDAIGEDWVPYMDDATNFTTTVGYRDPSSNIWYDKDGVPTSSAALRVGGEVQPALKDDEVSINSFKDYEPQTVVMPRLSFSFPISGEAVFFAHYDVLAQRPGQLLPTQGSALAGQLSDYYYLQNSATVSVTNSDLKPEKTIDYEVGFKQKLNDFMALSVSAFYREMRDMLQTQSFVDAYPISFTSFNNIDFGTVKGFTFALNMIRMKNIRMSASYTLQFATGTGSDFTSSRNALNSIEGFTAIRTLLPLNYDQRHRISGNIDYRFYGEDNKGPALKLGQKTVYPLANAGANATFYLGTGTPYSVNSLPDASAVQGGINSNIQLSGTPNGSRRPNQVRIDLKFDKDLTIGGKTKKDDLGNEITSRQYRVNVYLLMLNALNTKNILGVYRTSGLPDDDGYLSTGVGQQQIAAQIDPEAFTYLYTLKMQNPNNFSLPRRIRLGVQFMF